MQMVFEWYMAIFMWSIQKSANPRRPILAAATCEGFSGTGRSVPNLLRGLNRGEIMEKLVIKIVVRFQLS